ncbi:MAG: pyruvate formate-lyase-activating protein [Clostridia bacterium]
MTEFSLNSFLSLGGSDGPGIRSVIFLQGCPLRCDYCHNPETWDFKEADSDVTSLAKKVVRYKPYYKNGGGVTVSGGEPLCQQAPLIELFKQLKEQDIHTCIDTSAGVPIDEKLLEYTDLILCDIKFLSNEEYEKHTGLAIFENVVKLLELTKKHATPIWIRHVLYPNLTDNEEYVLKIKDFCKDYPNIERIELLPFKNICQTKYDDLGLNFKMAETPLISSEKLKNLRDLL